MSIDAAVARLREGGFIAYPTETVWGLGACADQPAAVDRLIAWKGRGSNAPLAVLVSAPARVAELGCTVGPAAGRLMDAFWPGPLMLVLPCARTFAPGVAGREGALGVRCSPHPVSAALARATESAGLGPLTSTSLNRTGEPPAATLDAARTLVPAAGSREAERAGLAEPMLLDPSADPAWRDGEAGGESPSTVVDCTGESPRILRAGAIPVARVEAVLAE